MHRVFSTTDVHQRDAFDYWHEVLCRKIVLHDCRPEDRRAFYGEIQSGSVACIDLVQYENAPMLNEITLRHAAHSSTDELLVRRQTAGLFVAEQDGREVT